jgi:hypothetical protein
MVALTLGVAWYGTAAVLRYFDQSIGRKTSAELEIRSQDGVQVSLQAGDFQAAEPGLKIYAGDAVATRSAGDVIVRFFDGTRIRLDQNTDVKILQSDKQSTDNSLLEVQLRSGRMWISTPTVFSFSGTILRTVGTENYSVHITPGSNVLISNQILNVLRASGLGEEVTLRTAGNPVFFVGEGQYFSLEGNAKAAIEQGADPYEFRDPVTVEQLKDEFLQSSYVLMNAPKDSPPVSMGSGAGLPDGSGKTPLTILSPKNREEVTAKSVTVSGRVGARVSEVLINGKSIPIKSDFSFTADVSIGSETVLNMTIEALDPQGITLAREIRTVVNAFKVIVEPPRIKSPAGSGETITVTRPIVEITGEAAPNTAGILVNDYRLQLFKTGNRTWSYLANAAYDNLKIGENRFTVIAVDGDGNRSVPRTVTVVYQPDNTTQSGSSVTQSSSSLAPIKQNPPLSPGTIIISLPTSGTSADTTSKELSIVGKTSPQTDSISVNGYTLSLYEPSAESWRYIASVDLGTMKRGLNVYRIVARNKSGEILDVLEYSLTYRP